MVRGSYGLHKIVNLVTAALDGLMRKEDKVKLDASTAASTASTLVQRDGNGDFAARIVTAALAGNAATASALSAGADRAKLDAATSANVAGALVQRDGNGDFAARVITATLTGNASTASSTPQATHANNADYATNAGAANTANSATSATNANHAANADYATNAGNASTAATASATSGNAATATALSAGTDRNKLDSINQTAAATGSFVRSYLPNGKRIYTYTADVTAPAAVTAVLVTLTMPDGLQYFQVAVALTVGSDSGSEGQSVISVPRWFNNTTMQVASMAKNGASTIQSFFTAPYTMHISVILVER